MPNSIPNPNSKSRIFKTKSRIAIISNFILNLNPESEFLKLNPESGLFQTQSQSPSQSRISGDWDFEIGIWLGSFGFESRMPTSGYSPFMKESSYDTIVDIIVPYTEVKISLQNVGLVLNVDKTFPIDKRFKRQKWTLFESLAIM